MFLRGIHGKVKFTHAFLKKYSFTSGTWMDVHIFTFDGCPGYCPGTIYQNTPACGQEREQDGW
jgi:hypothetical protein